MSLQVRNTKQLVDPDKYKAKILIYSLSGGGKTTWMGTVPNIGVIACETGQGKGLLSIATLGIDYVEPTSLIDCQAVVKGLIFKDKDAIGLDSLSDMNKTFIKDAALAVPRAKGDSDKRRLGVPELDDYGTMGVLTWRLLKSLIDLDKHIIVTATLKIDKPDMETGQGTLTIGPDLPGQMFLGSPAMFDIVLCLRTRPVDLRDKKNLVYERYFLTEGDGTFIAKSRAVNGITPLLDREEVFNLKTGQGTFPYLLNKILTKYREIFEVAKQKEVNSNA